MDFERWLLAAVTAFGTWAFLASPLLLAACFLGFRFRRTALSPWVRPVAGALLGLLTAPMPPPGMVPIIPPQVLAVLFEGASYPSDPSWAIISSLGSAIFFGLLAQRLQVPPNNSSKPTPLRGAA